MGLPWKLFALLATAASVLIVQYVPQYSMSASYIRTVLVYLSALTVVGGLWELLIHPNFFDPLRHLPSPPVSTSCESYLNNKC